MEGSRETCRKKKKDTGPGLMRKQQKLNWVLRRQASATQRRECLPGSKKEGAGRRSPPFLDPELPAEAYAPRSELRVQPGDREASHT